ncbi:MAG: hypothetical protein PHO39_09305 [Fermentimonas sp.]|nr:hypothetical protein [Fermentimonas sp.]
MSDPVGFLQNQGEKIIFDEAQHVPELFRAYKCLPPISFRHIRN